MRLKWAILLSLTVCLSWGASTAPPWEKTSQNDGRDLYRENCAVCHDIDRDQKHTRKLGPSLNHLFKNERLPMSHAKPSRPYVIVRIKFGGALMPAFAKQLDDSKINLLVDYIASK